MMDPPEHDRMRKLVSRVFTPRPIADLEPIVRDAHHHVPRPAGRRADVRRRRRLRGAVPGRDHLDDPRRARGRPPADPALDRRDAAPRARRPEADAGGHGGRAATDPVLPRARSRTSARTPRDDMITRSSRPRSRRRRPRSDSPTTRSPGSRTLLAGGRHRDRHQARRQRRRAVRPQPGRVAEGARRPGGALPTRSRRCCATGRRRSTRVASRTVASEWHGVTIPAGEPVFLLTGAANRDEREYEDPDLFDIDRADRLCASASATASTRASAPRWPGSRAGSRSRRSRALARATTSTTPACAGCTCRTSPASHTCPWRAPPEEHRSSNASSAASTTRSSVPSELQMCAAWRATTSLTRSMPASMPSAASEVTRQPRMPHGTMWSNIVRSGATLSAKPCIERPPRDSHADRSDLAVFDPDAGVSRSARARRSPRDRGASR